VCVLQDFVATASAEEEEFTWASTTTTVRGVRVRTAPRADGAAATVNVTLPGEGQIVDAGAMWQRHPRWATRELEMATRDVFCYTLLGYRVWNVAFKTTSNTYLDVDGVSPRGDCILMDASYEYAHAYHAGLAFNGSFAAFEPPAAGGGGGGGGANAAVAPPFAFTAAATPVLERIEPPTGMAGSRVRVHGRNLLEAYPVWDKNWCARARGQRGHTPHARRRG